METINILGMVKTKEVELPGMAGGPSPEPCPDTHPFTHARLRTHVHTHTRALFSCLPVVPLQNFSTHRAVLIRRQCRDTWASGSLGQVDKGTAELPQLEVSMDKSSSLVLNPFSTFQMDGSWCGRYGSQKRFSALLFVVQSSRQRTHSHRTGWSAAGDVGAK